LRQNTKTFKEKIKLKIMITDKQFIKTEILKFLKSNAEENEARNPPRSPSFQSTAINHLFEELPEYKTKTYIEQRQFFSEVRECVHDLMLLGIIYLGQPEGTNANFFTISSYGLKCLAEDKVLPYDPQGFLNQIDVLIPNLDPIIKLYLNESVNCYSARRYLASTVMIGGALERTIIVLTDAFARQVKTRKAEYQKAVLQTQKPKTKFENFLKFLRDNGYLKQLDRSTGEALESLFPSIVQFIRITRNDTGHPTGREINREEAEAFILLTVQAIEFSYRLI